MGSPNACLAASATAALNQRCQSIRRLFFDSSTQYLPEKFVNVLTQNDKEVAEFLAASLLPRRPGWLQNERKFLRKGSPR